MASFNSDGKAILAIFIGAIIAITFLGAIADSVFTQRNTIAVTNTTVTVPAVNATTDLEGRQLLSKIEIYNATNSTATSTLGGTGAPDGVSLRTAISGSTGLLSVQIRQNDSNNEYVGASVNISYTANPTGFLSNAGARSISGLTIIFGALAILVFIVVMLIKNGSLGQLMRRT